MNKINFILTYSFLILTLVLFLLCMYEIFLPHSH